MKHNCVKILSFKERWMPNLRQQTRRTAVWVDLTKQCTSQFPKCTSKCTSSSLNLQVFAMSFTSEFTILQVHL